jgi:hypothetical protein
VDYAVQRAPGAGKRHNLPGRRRRRVRVPTASGAAVRHRRRRHCDDDHAKGDPKRVSISHGEQG